MPPRPIVVSKAPIQSSLTPSLFVLLSGTRQIVTATTASAMGKLMKNTHRHDACWTNHPPRTGPIAVVIAVRPDQVPIARPRSSAKNDALIRARLLGTSSAPPTP